MEQAGEKQVKAVIHRCPFCHEGAEAEGSVACQGCLARHHEACWNESGRCGSCGSQQGLAPMARPALTVELVTKALGERGYPAGEVDTFFATLKAAPASRRRFGTSQLVATLVALAAVLLLGLQVARRWEAAQLRERNIQLLEHRQSELDAKRAELTAELAALNGLGGDASEFQKRRRDLVAEDLDVVEAELVRSQSQLKRAESE